MNITYTYAEDGPDIDSETYLKYVRAISEMMKLEMPDMVEEILNKMN